MLARAVGLALLLSTVGCSLVARRGPATEAQVECRQISQRGMYALDRQQWREAEELFTEALAICPIDVDARRYHAEALWNRGRREQALTEMDEALRLAGENPAIQIRAAEMRLELGQVDEALSGVQQALDIDPSRVEGWVVRGRIMQQQGDLRRALADYQRALAEQPGDADLLLRVAELYRRLDRPQQALANLHMLTEIYPSGEVPQQVEYLLGLSYLALGRPSDAIDRLAKASRDAPTPEILYRLAEAQWAAGRGGEARATAEQALTLAPEHPPTVALLERMNLAQNRSPASLQR